MASKVEIQTRNLQLKERLDQHVREKAGRLDRHLPQIEDVHIEIAFHGAARDANDRFTSEITARGKGVLLRAEEHGEEAELAFDLALDKLDRQIERFKGKHYHGRGDGRSAAEAVEPILDDDTGELSPLIARRKRFVLVPMSEEEAVTQMRDLGHDNFFVFFNAQTSRINVLYRRRNGSYGIIDPEMG